MNILVKMIAAILASAAIGAPVIAEPRAVSSSRSSGVSPDIEFCACCVVNAMMAAGHAPTPTLAKECGMTTPTLTSTSTTTAPAAPSLPYQGNTVATIAQQFPVVIEWQFTNYSAAQLNAQFAQFDPVSASRFSMAYYLDTNGNMAPLMTLAAQKLTAPNLVKWASVFGVAETTEYVDAYSPTAVRSAYAAAIASVVLVHQSHAHHMSVGAKAMTLSGLSGGVAAPTIYMTPYEIYTEYLFTEATTEAGAWALTAKFCTEELGFAWWVGHDVVGAGFVWVSNQINPSALADMWETWMDLGTDFFGPSATPTGTVTIEWDQLVTDWDGVCGIDSPC
jgi:hypothetical protein